MYERISTFGSASCFQLPLRVPKASDRGWLSRRSASLLMGLQLCRELAYVHLTKLIGFCNGPISASCSNLTHCAATQSSMTPSRSPSKARGRIVGTRTFTCQENYKYSYSTPRKRTCDNRLSSMIRKVAFLLVILVPWC